MYMFTYTYFIQNIVPKNVHLIMQKCVLQTASIMLAHPNVISKIRSTI